MTYCWKALNKGYNFAWDFISIRGLHTRLLAPKITRVPTLGILGLPLESLRTKCHLGASFMTRHKVYYKGESDGFPQVQVVVNFVSLCLHVAHTCTKNTQIRTNQLVVWFVHVCVSNWCSSFFLVPSQSSSTPLYPRSATSQGTCPTSLFFCYFYLIFTFEFIKELGNASPHQEE
jgi:hypothetical protein